MRVYKESTFLLSCRGRRLDIVFSGEVVEESTITICRIPLLVHPTVESLAAVPLGPVTVKVNVYVRMDGPLVEIMSLIILVTVISTLVLFVDSPFSS